MKSWNCFLTLIFQYFGYLFWVLSFPKLPCSIIFLLMLFVNQLFSALVLLLDLSIQLFFLFLARSFFSLAEAIFYYRRFLSIFQIFPQPCPWSRSQWSDGPDITWSHRHLHWIAGHRFAEAWFRSLDRSVTFLLVNCQYQIDACPYLHLYIIQYYLRTFCRHNNLPLRQLSS